MDIITKNCEFPHLYSHQKSSWIRITIHILDHSREKDPKPTIQGSTTVRRDSPLPSKLLQLPMSSCSDGYMVNSNTIPNQHFRDPQQ